MFDFINSLPWFRPSLGVLSAIAVLVRGLTPSYTIAHRVADFVINGTLPLGMASLGRSSTGVPPGAVHFPPEALVAK